MFLLIISIIIIDSSIAFSAILDLKIFLLQQCILGLHLPWRLHALLLWNLSKTRCFRRQNSRVFVLLKMLSRFCLEQLCRLKCVSGFVRVLWGVLLHLALFWMDLSQHVFLKSLVRVVVVLVLHRCLWYGRYIGNLFCLSISLLLPVFPCGFLFCLSLFSTYALFLFFSLSHTLFLFSSFHSLLYSFSLSSLWRFLSASLLVIILGLDIFHFLSCTHYP